MKTIVALCHFHRKIGPLVFYSYPDGILNEDLSVRIANIMDQTFSEGFFTHSFENLNSMNYYFEIHSDWARGNKEMLMSSVILEKMTSQMEQNVSRLLNEFSERLKSNKEIFKSFMIDELHNLDEGEREDIIKNNSLIKLWVKELYWATVEVTREKTEEEKIAYLLNKKHIFLTLAKLSKRPITLEGLKEWFKQNFHEKDFDKMIETLVENEFIFVNEIGRVEKFVLLLKEVNAERIPPDSVIDYIDDVPELIDLILPRVQKYFSNHENKSEEEINEDSFTLYQIISDPKKYNILSELRNGLIQRDKLPNLVSQRTLETLIETIDYLKQKDVIEELKYDNERYIILKTNLQITTAFPQYLRKLLPNESKPVVADKYSPKISIQQEEMADILKDVRDKGDQKSKESKIDKFLEDLSSGSKKNSSKK